MESDLQYWQSHVGGDFNLVPDLWMDRLLPRGQRHCYEEIISEFITKGSLIDCWRIKKPNTKQYTWYNSANNDQCSRLDFWLISTNLINEVLKCEISASLLTDHCAVSLSLPTPNSLWKLNSSLLDNEEFCKEAKNLLNEINQLEMSPLSKREWFKFKIKEVAIKISKYISKTKKQKQQDIIDINRLCQKTDLSLEEQIELHNLQNQLDSLYLELVQGLTGSKKVKKQFVSRQTKKKINKLLINNVSIDNQNQVNEEIRLFYNKLYESKFSMDEI